MEITEIIDKIEDAPESLREFYVQDKETKKFKFEPSAAVSGLKKNRDEILKEKANLAKKYEGVDLDAYEQWKKEQATAKEKELKEKGDWDAKEKSLIDAHTKELEKERQGKTRLMTALERNLITNATQSALNEAKVVPTKVKVLLPHIRTQLKVIEVDGDYVARVVDPAGQVRYQGGAEMTIAQLVAEFKADEAFSDCFMAETANGSGAAATKSNPNRDAGRPEIKDTGHLNPTEKLKGLRRTPVAKR